MTPCAHCATPGTGRFCCPGCATAAQLLAGAGLDRWTIQRPVPAVAVPAAWDDLAVLGSAVHHLPDGRIRMAWAVEGIHCPSCVVILERLPRLAEGITDARVDLARMSLCITADPHRCSPGDQARLAARLGYRLLPERSSAAESARRRDRRSLCLRTAVAGAAAIASMHLSLNLYAGELTHDLPATEAAWFAGGSLVAALPALWAALPWGRDLLHLPRTRHLSADGLAFLAVALGLGASVVEVLRGGTAIYADAVAMFTALLLLGRLILARVQDRVRAQTGRLDGLLPNTARRVDGSAVATERLTTGDELEVWPGERVPADGSCLTDGAWIDAAVLTGETKPGAVPMGAPVYAGTVVAAGHLRLRVEAAGPATRLAGILAQGNRAPAAHDAWAGRYLAIAAGLLLCGAITLLVLGIPGTVIAERTLAAALATCPCALGLALPILRATTVSAAARRGILITEPVALDRLPTCRTALLDKTGTLTEGRATAVTWTWHDGIDRQALVAAAEVGARHPLAVVLAGPGPEPLQRHEMPGHGVEATFADGTLRVGSTAWTGVPLPADAPLAAGIAWNGQPVGLVTAHDQCRPAAAPLVATLRRQGLTPILLSGDRAGPCSAVAAACGITTVVAEADPETKARTVRAHPAPLMVGDGVNDALALAEAHVAVGVRGGLAAALRCCHVALLNADRGLEDLAHLLATADAYARRRRWLTGWTWGYNGVAMLAALTGWWGPLVCAIGMPLSSLVAVGLATAGANSRQDPGSVKAVTGR